MNDANDILITGSRGFYNIQSSSPSGHEWLRLNVDQSSLTLGGAIVCDDTRMTRDITEAAFDAGLGVLVNGLRYIGDGMVQKG